MASPDEQKANGNTSEKLSDRECVFYVFEGSQYVMKALAALHWASEGNLESRGFRYHAMPLSLKGRKKLLPAPHTVPSAFIRGQYLSDSSDIVGALGFCPEERREEIEAADRRWSKALYPLSNLLTWKSPAIVEGMMSEKIYSALRAKFGVLYGFASWVAPGSVMSFSCKKAGDVFHGSMDGKAWATPEVKAMWDTPYRDTFEAFGRQLEILEDEVAQHGGVWVLPGAGPTTADFTVFAMIDRTVSDVRGYYQAPMEDLINSSIYKDDSRGKLLDRLPHVKKVMDTIYDTHGFGTVQMSDLRAKFDAGRLARPVSLGEDPPAQKL